MRVLICGYCVVETNGHLLIGTYKRALRLGMALYARGHRVALHAGGRDFYEDDLTRRAHEAFHLFRTEMPDATYEQTRDGLRSQMARFRPDLVALAEVPMGGPMLEAALCAVEQGIPVVYLDNVYNNKFARYFLRSHGAMADAIVFTGVSACHGVGMPPHVCQVGPFVDPRPEAARRLLGPAVESQRVVTVLGYDTRVRDLGLRIVDILRRDIDLRAVIITRAPLEVEGAGDWLHFVHPPDEETLAGLMQISDLAIGKCAFQQITECLMLGTPFIGLYYENFFDADILPVSAKQYVHTTSSLEPDEKTLDAARRFIDPACVPGPHVHREGESAALAVCRFLEDLPKTLRSGTRDEVAALGFTPERLQAALDLAAPPVDARATLVRALDDRRIYSLLAREADGGAWRRLWGNVYTTRPALETDVKRAPDEGRCIRHVVADVRITLEDDLSYERLPELI